MSTKEENNESDKEISSYLESNNIEFDYSFLFTDSLISKFSTSPYALNKYKLKNQVNASYIQLRVYNSKGKLYSGYSQCYGPFKKLNILDQYPPRIINHLPNNYDLELKTTSELWNITGEKRNEILEKSSDYDYTLVVYWNIWTNYFSREVLEKASSYATENNNPNSKILLILVNTAKD